jgi:hypothetical protein
MGKIMSHNVLVINFLHARNKAFPKYLKNEKILFGDEKKRDNLGP